MRRSRFGSKAKNGQSSHHISFYSRVRVGFQESTLKVREGCASRAYSKAKEGLVPKHEDKLRVTGQGPRVRRSLHQGKAQSQ
eukprot:6134394-Pleurochrysis_carterae.AAC.1